MAIDTALLFLSLVSFAALIGVWVSAPLHAADAPTSITEPAANAAAA